MPIICVDAVARDNNNRVLLLKRKQEPMKDHWWLPGGRVFKLEKLEEALPRLIRKETGLQIQGYYLLGHNETIFDTDPFGHNCKTHTVNFVYSCRVNGEVKIDNTSVEHMWWNGYPPLEHWYLKRYVGSR